MKENKILEDLNLTILLKFFSFHCIRIENFSKGKRVHFLPYSIRPSYEKSFQQLNNVNLPH